MVVGECLIETKVEVHEMTVRGYTSGELAELLQSPRSKVCEWLQRYQSDGVDGLLEGYRSGRPSELSQKQQQQLGDILDSGPVACGLASATIYQNRIDAEQCKAASEFVLTGNPDRTTKTFFIRPLSGLRPIIRLPQQS